MVDLVEARLDVGFQHPLVVPCFGCQVEDLGDRVLRMPVRAKPVRARKKVRRTSTGGIGEVAGGRTQGETAASNIRPRPSLKTRQWRCDLDTRRKHVRIISNKGHLNSIDALEFC